MRREEGKYPSRRVFFGRMRFADELKSRSFAPLEWALCKMLLQDTVPVSEKRTFWGGERERDNNNTLFPEHTLSLAEKEKLQRHECKNGIILSVGFLIARAVPSFHPPFSGGQNNGFYLRHFLRRHS